MTRVAKFEEVTVGDDGACDRDEDVCEHVGNRRLSNELVNQKLVEWKTLLTTRGQVLIRLRSLIYCASGVQATFQYTWTLRLCK